MVLDGILFFLLGCFKDAVLWSYADLNEIQPGVKRAIPTPRTHTRSRNVDVAVLLFKAGI